MGAANLRLYENVSQCAFKARLLIEGRRGAGGAVSKVASSAFKNVSVQPVLPFTALCDACGFSKQKMFMRRVYFQSLFITVQTPLQADGLRVARKLFISQQ